MGGSFIVKWDFKCGYCGKKIKVGDVAVYILKHEKKACEECAGKLIDKFYGKDDQSD